LFEAGDLHPGIAHVLYGEPAYVSPEASARAGQFKEKLIKLEEEVKRLKAIDKNDACRARSAGFLHRS
jgi:hypothetical protein